MSLGSKPLEGGCTGDYCGVIKGDPRSLDCSSHNWTEICGSDIPAKPL